MVQWCAGDTTAALKTLARALAHAQGSGGDAAEVDAWHELGRAFLAAQQPDDVRECILRARSLAPESAGVLVLEARLHQASALALSQLHLDALAHECGTEVRLGGFRCGFMQSSTATATCAWEDFAPLSVAKGV